MSSPSIVALIPARSGSKRVLDKNVRLLGDHPLIAYTIAAARASGIFGAVIISTDSPGYAKIARHYGAEVPGLRSSEISSATSPDIEWVLCALEQLKAEDRRFDCFGILRPTSPFRSPETIIRAWEEFRNEKGVDSLRAVEKVKQHPGKMWVVRGRHMTPLMPLTPAEQPWHSTQYAALPEVFVQNASLEIAWTRVVEESRTIAGDVLMPFFTEGLEGFDINDLEDWWYAEHLLETGQARLPIVNTAPFVQAPDPCEEGHLG